MKTYKFVPAWVLFLNLGLMVALATAGGFSIMEVAKSGNQVATTFVIVTVVLVEFAIGYGTFKIAFAQDRIEELERGFNDITTKLLEEKVRHHVTVMRSAHGLFGRIKKIRSDVASKLKRPDGPIDLAAVARELEEEAQTIESARILYGSTNLLGPESVLLGLPIKWDDTMTAANELRRLGIRSSVLQGLELPNEELLKRSPDSFLPHVPALCQILYHG